jgi:hypothetical protein
VHVDAEAGAEHAARIANAVAAVDRIADRQRMQHGAAFAQRMPVAGASTRAMSFSETAEPPISISAANNSLASRPAEIDSTTDSISTAGHALGAVDGWRMASSACARLTTPPALVPRAAAWPKPTTSTAWLRRVKTCCGACGRNRAITHATLLEPTSSAATSALRRGEIGFIFGVRP